MAPAVTRAVSDERGAALPSTERPLDVTPVHTIDLPATPQRDRAIPASAWIEAPDELRTLGAEINGPEARYIRRIGNWLLWRSGPPTKAAAKYLALWADDLAEQHSFTLDPDGAGLGVGPSGATHTRFRTWKEDLRDTIPTPRAAR